MDTLTHFARVIDSAQDMSIYYTRWQAMDALMTELADRYMALEFPRQSTILHLLKSLQAFAADQFKFFYYGFVHGQDKPPRYNQILEISPQFPPQDVLYAILDQIGHDLEIIQRAADQRILGGDRMRHTLANADKLAWRAGKPAIDYAVIEEATTVLTYFQKSTEFYRIPYAQVALIGIPFTCTSTDNHQDFLAIPHEMGHYVYRHPIGNAQATLEKLRCELEQKVPAYKDWLCGIFEEMFADIYGCLIAGPVMALDLQDVSLAESRRAFVNGDGSHPNPVLRPYIYCQVLSDPHLQELTADDWRPIAQKLAAHWDERLKQRHVEVFCIKTTEEGQDQKRVTITAEAHKISEAISDITGRSSTGSRGPLGDLVQAVADTIIEQILKYLEGSGSAYHNKLSGWSGKLTAKTEVGDLYAAYEEHFGQLLGEVKLLPPEADPSAVSDDASNPDAPPLQPWLDWVRENNHQPEGQWPLEQRIPSGDAETLDLMPDGTWGHILWADGWTTGGPTADPGHPFI